MNGLAPDLSQAARERFASGGEKPLLIGDGLRDLFIRCEWFSEARYAGANFSEGVREVQLGPSLVPKKL